MIAKMIINDRLVLPADEICSGRLAFFGPEPCPHRDPENGGPAPLRAVTAADVDKGEVGSKIPGCCKQYLGRAGHWGDFGELSDARLYKCDWWFHCAVTGGEDDMG